MSYINSSKNMRKQLCIKRLRLKSMIYGARHTRFILVYALFHFLSRGTAMACKGNVEALGFKVVQYIHMSDETSEVN